MSNHLDPAIAAAEREGQKYGIKAPSSRSDDATPSGNGLSMAEHNALKCADHAVRDAILAVEKLGRHRNYSLATTKLEEAQFWLRDRHHKAA